MTRKTSCLVAAIATTALGCGSLPQDDPSITAPPVAGAWAPTAPVVPVGSAVAAADGQDDAPNPAHCPSPVSASRPLSLRELRHTFIDLLGVSFSAETEAILAVALPGARSRVETSPLGPSETAAIIEDVSAQVIERADTLLPCPEEPIDPTCGRRFLRDFVLRAFRRPPTDAELDSLEKVLLEQSRSRGRREALGLVLEEVLSSGNFLTHPPSPAEDGSGSPDPWALANRLSYFFWETMPDHALFEAAESGALLRDDGFQAQVDRLVGDPRIRRTVARFHAEWLEVDPDDQAAQWPVPPTVSGYPDFWGGLKESAARFADHVFWQTDGTVSTFLRAPFVFSVDLMNPTIYGLVPPASAAAEKQDAPAGQRFGILTQPWFLAGKSWGSVGNPVARGAYLQRALFCLPVPPPPSGGVSPWVPPGGLTTREALQAHRQNPPCKACHRYLDPLGFALENYDGLGVYHRQDGGQPIDTSGALALGEHDIPFVDLPDLVDIMDASPEVGACVVQQWLRYALGRGLTDADTCWLAELARHLAQNGGRISSLLPALSQILR